MEKNIYSKTYNAKELICVWKLSNFDQIYHYLATLFLQLHCNNGPQNLSGQITSFY